VIFGMEGVVAIDLLLLLLFMLISFLSSAGPSQKSAQVKNGKFVLSEGRLASWVSMEGVRFLFRAGGSLLSPTLSILLIGDVCGVTNSKRGNVMEEAFASISEFMITIISYFRSSVFLY